MEAIAQWMNSEYLQTCRDYAGYLNNLSILLVTASAILCYKSINNFAFWFSCGGFLVAIVNLILGLNLYGDILGIILDFSSSKPDITKLKSWIYWQFWLGLLGLSLLVLSFVLSRIRKDLKND